MRVAAPRVVAAQLLSPARRWAFRLAALLLPVVCFAVLELGLRLAHVGDTTPLFVEARRAKGWLHVNPDVVSRFVVNPAHTPRLWIRPVAFPSEKPPATFRIFVQGGSTAAGYPYGYGASLAGMLQQRLQRTFPDRRIEVITTAVSAVNSYALLDFSGEILEQRPDAVLIYAGHNEYLGLLGVGSSFSMGGRVLAQTLLGLRPLRTLALGRRALAALTPRSEVPDRRSLMERVVARQQIRYGSGLYRRGLEQYRANMDALLGRYREAGVPVFIGTLVSNERDQPPFISGHTRDVDTVAWRRHFDAGLHALARGEAAAALAAFDTARALDDIHADVHFGRGRALEALGRFDEAHAAYAAARDRDELRFRAPEEMNDVLRKLATKHGAHVVEVAEAFHRASPHGVVGRDLMLEHLHPNVEGYFVMADAFYDALEQARLIAPWNAPVSEEQARRELPVTEVDRVYGEYRIQGLTAGWPFSRERRALRLPDPADRVEAIAQGYFEGRNPWPDAMRELLDHYRLRGDTPKAATVAALLADAFPYRAEDQRVAAELLRRAGRSDAAVYERRSPAEDAETESRSDARRR